MQKFLSDVWAVLRFDFKSLAHYVYPAWQPVLWVSLIGILGGIAEDTFRTGVLNRILFSLVLIWVGVVAQTLWLMLWQRYVRRKPVEGSLFPLIALLSSPQMLIPLLLMFLPENVAAVLMLLTLIYSAGLFIWGLSEVLDESGWRIVLAMLCFTPIAFVIMNLGFGFAVQQSWIELPAQTNVVRQSV